MSELKGSCCASVTLVCFSPSACVYLTGVCKVVDASKRISDVPEWFKGARLNYAENLLKHADQDKVALYAASRYTEYVAAVCNVYYVLRAHLHTYIFATGRSRWKVSDELRVHLRTESMQRSV